MSKKNAELISRCEENGNCSPSWGVGRVFDDAIYDALVGRILTIVEALGLPQKQEDSTKTLIRREISDILSQGIYIGNKTHSKIREVYYNNKDKTGLVSEVEII